MFEKPVPLPTEDSAPFWKACKEHELRMQRCNSCGHVRFPPSVLCPKCTSLDATWDKLSGRGEVFTFIIVHQTYHPAFDEDMPYNVALIRLEEGPGFHSNIVECKNEDLYCGMQVEVVFEDRTEEISLPKFRPRSS
jgi:uncharacterized OB-fold protein